MISSTQLSVNSPSTHIPYTKLPALHKKLVKLYYEDRLLGVDKSNRSLSELSKRFDRRPDYISRCLKEAEEWGHLESDPHGSAFKNRWITFRSFSELESQSTSQITNQIVYTPYIDLLDSDQRSIKIFEEPHDCGQIEENLVPINDESFEVSLEKFLIKQKVDKYSRTIVMNAFKSSPINVYEKINIYERVVRVNHRKGIKSLRAYLLACIVSQERTIKILHNAFEKQNENWMNL